ncbi:MAG: D-amino acid aminotransferase [Gammaproteobacteria bacterium]|nr:D-amino acid aminotransferase [Gammaproteobacteria bacterium]
MPVAYLNGKFLPVAAARISPLDRGFLFADGVYEVIPVYAGRLFRPADHLRRLQSSLDGIRLQNPHDEAQWSMLLERLVRENGGGYQALYLQVTRGTDTGRDHAFPQKTPPTVFAMASALDELPAAIREHGVRAITLADIRWHRCDIKSVALLGHVLLRQTALEQHASEAILLRDGHATEGSASNLFIVDAGVIVTPPKSTDLLPGITRDLLLELAVSHGLAYRESRIPETQLHRAQEIWLSSSTREVYAVTELDGRGIGDGKPGPLWRCMYDYVQQYKTALLSAAP